MRRRISRVLGTVSLFRVTPGRWVNTSPCYDLLAVVTRLVELVDGGLKAGAQLR
jgi:hypothetical protein